VAGAGVVVGVMAVGAGAVVGVMAVSMALVSMVVSEVPVSMVVISMAVVSMVAAVTVDRSYFSRINNQESDIVEFRPLIVVPIAEVKRIVIRH